MLSATTRVPGRARRLQAGGEVWRLADHAPFLRGTSTDQIANDDEARGDADPNVQRLLCSEPNCRAQFEPRADRALGVVFVCSGVAKKDERGIPESADDEPVVAIDRL